VYTNDALKASISEAKNNLEFYTEMQRWDELVDTSISVQLPGRCLVIDGSRLPLAKLDPFLHDCFSLPQPLVTAPKSCAVLESTFANYYTKTIQSIGSQTFAYLGDVAIPSVHLPLFNDASHLY
jgi:hypothetical protein